MKEIILGESTTVAELSQLLHASVASIVKTAFHELGLMATADQPLSFEEASTIAAEFGHVARRRNSQNGGAADSTA